MIRVAGLVLLLVAAKADASSPAAWAAHDRAAARACILASGLRAATASKPIPFHDTVGRTAMLVTGTYPRRFMKAATGRMLCLFDRRTGHADTSEAMDLRSVTDRSPAR